MLNVQHCLAFAWQLYSPLYIIIKFIVTVCSNTNCMRQNKMIKAYVYDCMGLSNNCAYNSMYNLRGQSISLMTRCI
jgi:hypothetical protein